ncbi:MAG: response regulator [Deltaproteobacteria bacterium]|nr:response regulator [Deltaproteobacteria bacterium]
MQKKRILVVDDEEDIRELVGYNLSRDGYMVDSAVSGEEALKITKKNIPDLILLDLMLPGIDGLETARRFKNDSLTSSVPIIILTAKGDEADIVTGLELGADDYVTKPFSPRILNARVKAVLRRKEKAGAQKDDLIKIFDLELDPGRREIKVCGRAVELTFSQFQLLHFLIKRPGWVFTRTQIIDAVQGDDYAVTDRSVDVQIVSLRKKLETCGKYIETVRGVGYRFREKP